MRNLPFLARVYGQIKSTVALIALLLMMCNIVVGLIGLAAVVIIGPWDLLVWLTNANWKTSNFVIPALGLFLLIAAIVINKGILTPILDWAEDVS